MTSPDEPAMQPRPLSNYGYTAIPDGPATLRVSIVGDSHLKCFRRIIVVSRSEEEEVSIPCFSFLLEREDGSSWLFDLGMRPDPENGPPQLSKTVEIFKLDGTRHPEPFSYLRQLGYDVSKIRGAFLSHSHFDHYGDLDSVPSGTPIIVGPGSKAGVGRGYPADPTSTWFTRWLANPDLVELPPVETEGAWGDSRFPTVEGASERKWTPIGAFEKGLDFFGDGSLWLVDTPGHCYGHMCGLVRTTSNPPTYLLLAGDACHHASNYLPVPTSPSSDKRTMLPFFTLDPSKPLATMDYDSVLSTETVGRLTKMSAEDEVMVLLAHEEAADGLLPRWPETLNDWRRKGWKEEKQKGLVRSLDATGFP